MTTPILDTPQSILCNIAQGLINVHELAERGQLSPALLARCLIRWKEQLQQALALLTVQGR